MGFKEYTIKWEISASKVLDKLGDLLQIHHHSFILQLLEGLVLNLPDFFFLPNAI